MAKQVIRKYAYLKLGAKANTFYDPSTGISISNKQVIRLHEPNDLSRETIAKALQTNHIQLATEDDYTTAKALHAKQVKDSQKNLKKPQVVYIKKEEIEEDGEADFSGNSEDTDELDEDNAGLAGADTEEDDDEDEEEAMTKSDFIDALKASPLIKDEEKKNLTKLSMKQLQNLYDTMVKGK